MIKKKLYTTGMAVSLLSLAAFGSQAQAAGFYIQEQSVSGLGSAYAGAVADVHDSSIVYYNPAGMTFVSGPQMQVGAHALMPNADYKDTGSVAQSTLTGNTDRSYIGVDGGNPYELSEVPNMFLATPLFRDDIWAGLGVTAPFGLANEYDNDFVGRYDSTSSALQVIDIQPSLAMKVTPKLSLGFGLNVQYAHAILKSALPDSSDPTPSLDSDGQARLKGNDWTIGYTAGLYVEPTEETRFGFTYKTGVSHELDGSQTRILPQVLNYTRVDSPGTAGLDLPDIGSFGMSHDVSEKLTLLGQVNWFKWSNFDSIPVYGDNGALLSRTVQNYNDTWAFSVGAKYKLTTDWTVRGGFQFDPTPTEDGFRSTRTPDGDRMWFSTGATWDISDHLSLDLAATYIDIDQEQINLTRTFDYSAVGAGVSTVSINGESEGDVGILALGLNYRF